jgi:hypothetical protein
MGSPKRPVFEHIGDLKPDGRNARKHGERNISTIEKSLERFGAARSIVVDETGRILAGNGLVEAAANVGIERVKTVEADGNEIIAVVRRGLTEEQKIGLSVADNQTGLLSEWDAAVLKELSDEVDLSAFFTDNELAGILGEGVDQSAVAHATLAERFGIPPFSVLDARQGYWQERKAAWIALGIQSELGRGGNLLDMSAAEAGITDPAEIEEWNRQRRLRHGGTPPHPPTVTQNSDGTLNYGGTSGQAKRFDAQRERGDGHGRAIRRKPNAIPGGGMMPLDREKARRNAV